MTEVLLVGDVHGDEAAIDRAYSAAIYRDISHIVFMGDVGVGWNGSMHDCPTLALMNGHSNGTGIRAHVLLGNHENWDTVDIYRERYSRTWVTVLQRSGVFFIEEHPIAYQAGGCSIDQYDRVLGKSYWRQELPTEADLEELKESVFAAHGANYTIKLFLSHDSAEDPPMRLSVLPRDLEEQCQQSRGIVARGAQYSGAKLLVHGHFHHPYDPLPTSYGFQQMGLAQCDGHPPRGMAIIDLDTLQHTWIG